MKFIGLDLAWSSRNPTGGAVIAGDTHGGKFGTMEAGYIFTPVPRKII